MSRNIFRVISGMMPGLKHELRQAGIAYEPEDFIKSSIISSLIMSFGISFLFIGGMLKGMGQPVKIIFLIFPILAFILFNYFMKVPAAKIHKKANEISKEIVFATRFLIIEIESGVPIYDCFVNISKSYPAIGSYFKAIVESVNMGTSMEDAINEIIELSPSQDLRKILWQIINTLNTGADVTKPLNSVLDQIIKDQKIEVEEYGRKLNPLAMFYMMVAVILPSLGTAMLIIFASFIGFKLNLLLLIFFACLTGFVQFMFYAMIKSSRPPVDI